MITYFIVWIFLMLFCIFYLWDKFSIAHSVIQVNFRVVDILWHILTLLLSLDTKCRCSSLVPFASKCVLCVYLLLFLNFFFFFFLNHIDCRGIQIRFGEVSVLGQMFPKSVFMEHNHKLEALPIIWIFYRYYYRY